MKQGADAFRLIGVAEFTHPQGDPITPELLLQPFRGAFSDHPAGVNDRHAIRQRFDLLQVMAAEQHAGALRHQLTQQLPDRRTALDVQTNRRFIQHQQAGTVQ